MLFSTKWSTSPWAHARYSHIYFNSAAYCQSCLTNMWSVQPDMHVIMIEWISLNMKVVTCFAGQQDFSYHAVFQRIVVSSMSAVSCVLLCLKLRSFRHSDNGIASKLCAAREAIPCSNALRDWWTQLDSVDNSFAVLPVSPSSAVTPVAGGIILFRLSICPFFVSIISKEHLEGIESPLGLGEDELILVVKEAKG